MKNHSSIINTLLIIFLLGAGSVASAANKAGQIIFSRGVVSILDANDSRRGGRTGAEVFEGERIVTGRNGIVQLHLTDDTLIGLRGNSEYLIKRQRYGETAEAQAAEEEEEESLADQAGELFSGWMRMVTGAIGKSNPANVRQSTSVATIGIRGTVFQVIHVPEEGLPGFPPTEPGTYLLLEEGEIEITGEGGSRIVRPGEVVFVPKAGGVPRPAPEKRDLFLFAEDADSYDGVDEYDGELDLADLSEAVNETVTERLSPSALPEFSRTGMISVFGGTFGGAGGGDLQLAGSGASRYPLKASMDNFGATTELEVLPGETPTETGYYVVTGQGSAAKAEVFWGKFTDAQYNRDGDAGSGDWHYMLASQVLYDLAELNSRFPSGQFFYTFVDGTPLAGDQGGVLVIDTGTAEVNLLNLDVFIQLSLSGAGTYNMTGSGSLAEFLDTNGISLFDAGISGTITGAFVGDGLDGMISAINVTDTGGENFQGTALFEQDSGSAGGRPLSGVSSTFFNSADVVGQSAEQTLSTSGSGENRVLTSIFNDFGIEGNDETRVTDTTTPLAAGGVQLKDGTFINWGAWAAADYEFLSNGLPGSPAVDVWKYVIGDYLIPEAVLTDAGRSLRGTYAYTLAGATPLFDAAGVAQYQVTSAQLVMDFATGEFTVIKITTDVPNAAVLESLSIASLFDFYGGGIGLLDFTNGGEANLKGAFFGEGAAGIGAYLSVSESFSGPTYDGTLGFVRGERANEQLFGHFDNSGGARSYDLQFIGYTVDGEGADRVVRDLTYDDGFSGIQVVESIGGLEPASTGYQQLADGTEVNWGIWTVDSYTVNGSAPLDVNWHYMLAENVSRSFFDAEQLIDGAGLNGEFTYNFVGGTQLQGENFASNIANITDGFFTVDLSTSAITGFGMDTDNVNLGSFITDMPTPTIGDLYTNSFSIQSTTTGATGVMGGYVVGTGAEGLATNISINDGVNENYFGTALFERGLEPDVVVVP